MLFFESPALCLCQTVVRPVVLHSFTASTTSFKDIIKTHRCKNHRNVTLSDHFSMNPPFVKQEVIPASYTSLWDAPLPLDSHMSTVHLSAQTRIRVMTPQLFCSHIVFHSTMIIIKITSIQCHENCFLIVGQSLHICLRYVSHFNIRQR